MSVYRSAAELIGGTPLLELQNYQRQYGLHAKIFAKLECYNPAGSVKDRVALAMIEAAEAAGALKAGATIIEPTSGNTGIGLAAVGTTRGYKVILTTDHGTIRVDNPIKVVGDRNTTTNLRYKVGKNLNYNPKQVYEIHNPKKYGLPAPNLSSIYIFATNEDFFSYPNNYNYYVQYYTGTFQHGGISLQEMLVPLVTLTPKGF